VPHQPSVVRHRAVTTVTAALVALVGLAPAASAQTVIPPAEAPFIVQGKACVGEQCPTTAPGLSLDVTRGDTPGVRLDQPATGGFVPQIWDVAGNEANFFVRDLTGGSLLPFRIQPGSPTNSLTLKGGRVGIGTWEPASALHVARTDGTAALQVSESNGTVASRTLATLENNGPVALQLSDGAADVGWTMATAADGTVALTPTGPGVLPSLVLSSSGTATARAGVVAGGGVTAGGTVQQTADPASQSGVTPVDVNAVADAIRTLPIERFGLASDGGAEHLAPNGAAFRTAFGLGGSDARIAPGDVAAVALTGVQALLSGEAGVDVAPLAARVDAAQALLAELGKRVDAADAVASGATKTIERQDARVGAAEQVQHGHERRIRELERQATLADSRFERGNRVQKALRGQVSSLRNENARLEQRLDAIEAAIAKRR